MSTDKTSAAALNEPLARNLLQSKLPAQFAYNWHDGTPRVVPMGFHWNGQEIVICSPLDAPKMRVLQDEAKVALTISSETNPGHVLLIRGSIRIDIVEGIPSEYAAMSERTNTPEGSRAWLEQARQMWPRMARIAIKPEWVRLLDFQTQFPSAVERGLAR